MIQLPVVPAVRDGLPIIEINSRAIPEKQIVNRKS